MTRPIPPGTHYAWTAVLFAIYAVYDGFPDPTSLYWDQWGHTYIAMAGYPPVSLAASEQGECYNPNLVQPPVISYAVFCLKKDVRGPGTPHGGAGVPSCDT